MTKQELTEDQIIRIKSRIDHFKKIRRQQLENMLWVSADMTERVIISLKTWL